MTLNPTTSLKPSPMLSSSPVPTLDSQPFSISTANANSNSHPPSGLPHVSNQLLVNASLALKLPTHFVGTPSTSGTVIQEGWMLKKRRKKLQGYARRYFILRSTGYLAYSFTPGAEVRDQIFIPSAALASTQGRRDIHVDSGRSTFHIKCLTLQEFELWMNALRKFTTAGSEPERSLGRRPTISRGFDYSVTLDRATSTVDAMGDVILELVNALSPLDETILGDPGSQAPDKKRNGKTRTPDQHTSKEGPSILALFRKSSHQGQQTSNNATASSGASLYSISSSYPYDKLLALIDSLREKHRELTTTLSHLSNCNLPGHNITSPIHSKIDEGLITPTTSTHSLWQAAGSSNVRTSFSSMWSNTDGSSVWFDAIEGEELGAGEFVVSEHDEIGEDDSVADTAVNGVDADSSADRHDESEVEAEISTDETTMDQHLSVARRSRLPSKPTGDEGSLFAVLKKNVGQDLSNISFPVSFNEPLTLLQRSAEEFEYHSLLDRAASTSDWLERICHVAAFAVSGYACTKLRSGRKGFTPLLGETFEDIRMNFIAEKVVHKPLVIAYHAHGQGWEMDATSSGKTKFWGKSFEIIPTGNTYLTIGEDVFEWNKPSSFTRNLMMGTKYLEHCGEMLIKNQTSGATCLLDFKETGYWGSTPNAVSGVIRSKDGDVVGQLEGKWDEHISQKLDSSHLRVLWRISPFPRNVSEYYGFTYFGITLNEITPDVAESLPCTDSRFRADVRALEEGDIQLAEVEKLRLEQLQRDRRQNGREPKPRWFRQLEDSDRWVYSGGYWESRRNGWKNVELERLW